MMTWGAEHVKTISLSSFLTPLKSMPQLHSFEVTYQSSIVLLSAFGLQHTASARVLLKLAASLYNPTPQELNSALEHPISTGELLNSTVA
jgi:hypothetical protein